MPSLSEAFPSKFISASDLQGREATVKITHVSTDEIGGKQKFICFFAGKQKGLVLNKTNWNSIARISGHDNSDDWTGVNVCLYETMVDFQGDSVPAVRIKNPPKQQQAPQQTKRARPSSTDMVPDQEPPPRDHVPDMADDEIGF